MTTKIATSPLTGRIHAGRVNKAGNAFIGDKRDVTSDVLCAVIEKAAFHGGTFDIEGGGKKWLVTVSECSGASAQPADERWWSPPASFASNWLTNGAALHPLTVNLVVRFARALAKKLAAAEVKYGYSDGWRSPDWMDECRAKLLEHIAKGDPRDVAAYCAFLWHHDASTAAAAQPAEGGADHA